MPINYTQRDTGSLGDFSNCSGRSNSNPTVKTATDGGTAGVTEATTTLIVSDTLVASFKFRLTIDAGISWNAGTWTWRLNVTSSNMNVTLNEVHICRLNSSRANQATIGSATGLGISLGTTGVKSGTISGGAQSPSVGDDVWLIFIMTNGSSMVNSSYGVTPDQNIDSPFDIPVVVNTGLLPFCISPQPTR